MATSSETFPIRTAAVHASVTGDPIRRNVIFSVVDYVIQPLLMLLTARYFVKMLGISVFGTWMLVLAIIGSSGSICTGFGDAALKHVAMMRGRLNYDGVARVIGSSLVLNATLGLAMALVLGVFASWASRKIFHLSEALAPIFVSALRIGACVLLVRALSAVFVGTLKAFEHYQKTTQITASVRVAASIVSLCVVYRGLGVVAVCAVTLMFETVAMVLLARATSVVCGRRIQFSLLGDWRAFTSFGFFNWVQAVSGTLFSQADRLLVAALLGPASLSYYGVCVQCAQPIHGLLAAGNNVLFPHLSTRLEASGTPYLRWMLGRVFWRNILFVCGLTLPLVLLGRPILAFWMGKSFSDNAAPTLALVAISFSLIAVNIPGHYALMALGEVRFLTAVNVAGCVLALLFSWTLIPQLGIQGAALGRAAYGPLTWLVYARLRQITQSSENA